MTDKDLKTHAGTQSGVWEASPYYAAAEAYIEGQWRGTIWPRIRELDFRSSLDLAAGHGRNSEFLLQHCERLTVVDLLQSNIDACRERLQSYGDRVRYVQNDGFTLQAIDSGSITLVYCFDAMVHFDSDVVRSYLGEIHRVLTAGGHAFLHHSNLDSRPAGDFRQNPHARAFMSAELMQHYAHKESLDVVSCEKIDWGANESFVAELDCLTLLRKSR